MLVARGIRGSAPVVGASGKRLLLRTANVLVSSKRCFAKVEKKKKSEDKVDTAPADNSGKISLEMLNIFKDVPPQQAKPDSEYPEWLWTMDVPLPTYTELRRSDYDQLPLPMQLRYDRLLRKSRIKAHNSKSKRKT